MPRRLPRSLRGRGVNGNYPDGTPRRRPRARRSRNTQGIKKNSASFTTTAASSLNPGMSIRNQPVFGQRARRTLNYSGLFIGITSGAGTAGNYIFSANGLFDTDVTSTGGQPMGFDPMMAFFNHYTVYRSRIRAIFSSTSAVAPMVGIAVSGSPVPLTDIERIVENGRMSFAWLEPQGIANSKAMLSATVDIAKFEGKVNPVDDPDLGGSSVANPVEQCYFILYCFNGASLGPTSCIAQVFIEFDTIFYEPRDQPLS
jgi:hypothetical protein